MTQLSPALDAALSGPAPTIFGTVAIDLPGRQLNLLSEAGRVTFGGRTFVGRDATYGTLQAMENLTDGMGTEAPRLSMTLTPASDAAAADLAAPEMQGSLTAISFGAVNPATGQVIGTHLLFLGELDVPIIKAGADGREIEYEVASIFERFFSEDEGIRLSPGFHEDVWPGERGLAYLNDVPQGVYWGVERPPTAARVR
jgi:hypothetical protein